MKHAGPAALDRLEPLLAEIRTFAALKEKGRGVFYLKARAFLHFHEDAAGLFADVRAADGKAFDRLKVDEVGGRTTLMERLSLASRGMDGPQPPAASDAARLS